jgi:hypothetical protein
LGSERTKLGAIARVWVNTFCPKQLTHDSKPTNVEKSLDSVNDVDRLTLKRLRNRVSASRCRQKKKVWMGLLEKSVKDLEALGSKTEKYLHDLDQQRAALQQQQ